jgi:hypothetical protein
MSEMLYPKGNSCGARSVVGIAQFPEKLLHGVELELSRQITQDAHEFAML